MNLDSNDFELFDLPQRFEQETAVIDARWRALQGRVHPDRFAAQGAAAQRVAMQWAVRVNEAHQRLRSPIKRAAYLCALRGQPVDAETPTRMSPEFLAQQMAWREALEAAGDGPGLQALSDEVGRYRAQVFSELAENLDVRQDAAQAAQQVRSLMFVERFVRDLERRMDAS